YYWGHCRRLTGLLIKTDCVSAGVADTRGDFRRIGADRLYDFAARGDDRFDRGRDAVHHDVNHQPRRSRRRSAQHPRPAHLADAIVERGRAVAALADLPAEDFRVERCGAVDVARRKLDVTDFAVTESWWHAGLINHF